MDHICWPEVLLAWGSQAVPPHWIGLGDSRCNSLVRSYPARLPSRHERCRCCLTGGQCEYAAKGDTLLLSHCSFRISFNTFMATFYEECNIIEMGKGQKYTILKKYVPLQFWVVALLEGKPWPPFSASKIFSCRIYFQLQPFLHQLWPASLSWFKSSITTARCNHQHLWGWRANHGKC